MKPILTLTLSTVRVPDGLYHSDGMKFIHFRFKYQIGGVYIYFDDRCNSSAKYTNFFFTKTINLQIVLVSSFAAGQEVTSPSQVSPKLNFSLAMYSLVRFSFPHCSGAKAGLLQSDHSPRLHSTYLHLPNISHTTGNLFSGKNHEICSQCRFLG